MKGILLSLCVALLLVGCSKENVESDDDYACTDHYGSVHAFFMASCSFLNFLPYEKLTE
ncbi:hypothetical protein [Sporosarcina sp. SAFN-015]|uniref:hypothetical protein n=1 Tax=Sporosarcina sp. SAFN-015 TaxID=3387274 RepID=UPI003F7E7C28